MGIVVWMRGTAHRVAERIESRKTADALRRAAQGTLEKPRILILPVRCGSGSGVRFPGEKLGDTPCGQPGEDIAARGVVR